MERKDRFKKRPESVVYSRKALRAEVKIWGVQQRDEVRLQLMQVGDREDFKVRKIGGTEVSRVDWDERAEAFTFIASFKQIMIDKEHGEVGEHFPFINNRDDYQLYVLKRVTAMVIAEFAGRIHARTKKIEEEREVNYVSTMKLLTAIRKRVREILIDVEKELDEDFSELLLLRVDV